LRSDRKGHPKRNDDREEKSLDHEDDGPGMATNLQDYGLPSWNDLFSNMPDGSTIRERSSVHLASLLDLSSRIAEAAPLDILNVAVLSIMGRLRIQRACVLVPIDGNLVAESRLCKGVVPFSVPVFDLPFISPVNDLSVDTSTFMERGLTTLVPISTENELQGVICLGEPLHGSIVDDGMATYLELARMIVGTTLHNSVMVASLVGTQKELEARNLLVTTLFESARDFTGAKTRDELLRIMSYRLMGQLMVTSFALFVKDELGNHEVILSKDKAMPMVDVVEDVINVQVPLITERMETGDPLRAILESVQIAMIAPIMVHGNHKGVLAISTKLNGLSFTKEELTFLEAIGNTAFSAMENERLIKEEMEKKLLQNELEIAATIQRGLLPTELPAFERLEIAAEAKTSRMIGGDYYDVIQLDEDHVLVAIADVAGKGIPAALLMANVQAALNVLAHSDVQLPYLLTRINTLVCENTKPEVFITMFIGIINATTLDMRYVNAGHNPPLVLRKDSVDTLNIGGILTGVLADPPPYEEGSIQLQTDDVVILYTDGVTEARNEGGELGVDGLIDQLRSQQQGTAQEIVASIHERILQHAQSGGYDDDTSLVVIKVR
jgi:phosphoserine phosphatase RsbU/P